MFPTELEISQRRKDYEQEAAQHRLAQYARTARPSFWQRLSSRRSGAPGRRVEQFANHPAAPQPECA